MEQDFRDSIPSGDDGLLYNVKYTDGTVTKACLQLSAENTQQGDGIGAQLINQLAMKDPSGNPVVTVISQRDFYNSQMEYTHTRKGTIHRLYPRFAAVQRVDEQGKPIAPDDNRIQLVQFAATASYEEDDTFEVGGVPCTAKAQGGGSEMLDGFFASGDLVSALLQTGKAGCKLVFRAGGMPTVPGMFGNGSDGDLYIAAGETVVLPVLAPHRTVVEKQYMSITIEEGGVLRCSDPNAGLVLRCRRACSIKGTIDQNGMSPKLDSSNIYPYPRELVCGTGGIGNRGSTAVMAVRPCGGAYGTGGGGGGGANGGGGAGGSTDNITVDIVTPFVGGRGVAGYNSGGPGSYGGGGGGGGSSYSGSGGGGSGGSGAGGGGAGGKGWITGGGGGAGNVGGGVMLLYVGGQCSLSGALLCQGKAGGSGGAAGPSTDGQYGGPGGGGGGGGGGAVYIVHNTTISNSAIISASGGVGGAGGGVGQAGGAGTVTIKKFVKGMTA